MLVYMFGSQGQGGWLFRIWLVSMQVLDVHRRFLSGYLGVAASSTGLNGSEGGGGLNGTSVFGPLAGGGSGLSSGHGAGGGGSATFEKLSPGGVSSSMIGQQHSAREDAMLLPDVVASVWGYYTEMLCTTGPASICNLITSPSSSSSVSVLSFLSTLAHAAITATTTAAPAKAASISHSHATYSMSNTGSSKASPSSSSPSSTGGVAGMKEMENLVVFEILAGVGVSGLMCLVWAAMAIRRGGLVAIPGVRRTRARVQRWGKTVKGLRDEWWVGLEGLEGLERKVDALVEQMKFRVES